MVFVKRAEKSPLDRFKGQNALVKKFGKKSLILLNSIPSGEFLDWEEIKRRNGDFDEANLEEIFSFLESSGIIDVSEEQPALQENETAEEEPNPAPKQKQEEEKPEKIEAQKTVAPQIKTIEKELPNKEETELTIQPEITPEGVDLPKEESQEKEEKTEKSKLDEIGESTLSQFENEVKSRFGLEGVLVYRQIKEGVSVEEVYETFSGDREKLQQIINFLKEMGYILEEKRKEEEEPFAPLSGKLDEDKTVEEPKEILKSVDTVKTGLIERTREKMSITMKYGRDGRFIFDNLNPGTDVVSLVKSTKVPLGTVEDALKMLEKDKFITAKPLGRNDLKKKFGEDSYIIYKKYGKTGLVFYELVGGEFQLKEIARLLNLQDREKVVEIFMFIHDLLNIDVPVDKELLMKRLE